MFVEYDQATRDFCSIFGVTGYGCVGCWLMLSLSVLRPGKMTYRDRAVQCHSTYDSSFQCCLRNDANPTIIDQPGRHAISNCDLYMDTWNDEPPVVSFLLDLLLLPAFVPHRSLHDCHIKKSRALHRNRKQRTNITLGMQYCSSLDIAHMILSVKS